MLSKRSLLTFFAAGALSAATGLAQELPATGGPDQPNPAEFGRVSGGEIEALVKQPSQFSGSLGLTASRSSEGFFPGGSSRSYGATLGGTLLKDRVWFFGTAETNGRQGSGRALSPTIARSISPLAFGTMNARLGDRQDLTASYARGSNPLATLPSSFLSLHYTGIVSSNMFFTASVSQQSVRQSGFTVMTPTP